MTEAKEYNEALQQLCDLVRDIEQAFQVECPREWHLCTPPELDFLHKVESQVKKALGYAPNPV